MHCVMIKGQIIEVQSGILEIAVLNVALLHETCMQFSAESTLLSPGE